MGPRSMLKMLLDANGSIVLTNDGNAILREIDVTHPAAKSMIELSRTQDEACGGTGMDTQHAGEMQAGASRYPQLEVAEISGEMEIEVGECRDSRRYADV